MRSGRGWCRLRLPADHQRRIRQPSCAKYTPDLWPKIQRYACPSKGLANPFHGRLNECDRSHRGGRSHVHFEKRHDTIGPYEPEKLSQRCSGISEIQQNEPPDNAVEPLGRAILFQVRYMKLDLGHTGSIRSSRRSGDGLGRAVNAHYRTRRPNERRRKDADVAGTAAEDHHRDAGTNPSALEQLKRSLAPVVSLQRKALQLTLAVPKDVLWLGGNLHRHSLITM